MGRGVVVSLLVLIGLWVGLSPSLQAGEVPEPRVVCSNIAPFVFSEQGIYRGYAYELGQAVMQRLGYHGAIEVQPLARANRTVQSDANVIALWVGRIPERESSVHWLYPVVIDDFSVYTVKGRPVAPTLELAKSLKMLGANIGAANAVAARRKGLERIELITSDDANGRKLMSGRIDGWIASSTAVNYFLRLHGLPDDTLVKGVKLSDYQAWVVASLQSDPAVRAAWQATLHQLALEGALSRLADGYRIQR